MAHGSSIPHRLQKLARELCEVRPQLAPPCKLCLLAHLVILSTLFHVIAVRLPTAAWLQVVAEFGLVHFLPLAIEDKDSVQAAVAAIDKATGHVFKGLETYDPYPEMTYAATAQPVHIPSSIDAAQLDSNSTASEQEKIGKIVERTALSYQ